VTSDSVSELVRWVDLTGVLFNAILGGVLARTKRLDPIGFCALAIMSGLGGGMIRETLLQRGTPVALTDYAYIVTALAGAAIAFLVQIEGLTWDRVFPWVDAFALGCWAAAGAQKTLSVGLGWLPALLLGVITAVGGGFTRDVVLRRVPQVLGGNTLYATCALLASGVAVLSYRQGYADAGLLVAMLVGAALTLVARWRRWMLPLGTNWQPLREAPDRMLGALRDRSRTRSQQRQERQEQQPPGDSTSR